MVEDFDPTKIDRNRVGVIMNEEKLICLIGINDAYAPALAAGTAGEAYFRAFVVENRETGKIHCKFRYRYVDGDSWGRLELSPEMQAKSRAERVAHIVEGWEKTFTKVIISLTNSMPSNFILTSFNPDVDNPDWQKTIRWMKSEDLLKEPEQYEKDR